MKYFGTVKSFDAAKGHGEIKPETGSDMLGFDRSAFAWEKNSVPVIGQRLSYDVGADTERRPCALNLKAI
jgi:cold shock CspA family protein